MKLFVWKDYMGERVGNGAAFALAETVEQARELIVQFETKGETSRFANSMRDMVLAHIDADPDFIIDANTPFAFGAHGGG